MDKNTLKLKTQQCIDRRQDEIITIGQKIYHHPETGFKERQTSELVENTFRELKLNITKPDGIPGVKVTIDTGKEGPGVAVLGELDSIVCADHPDSNRETGAVHACGHNIQIADMIGTAMGLLDAEAAGHLAGKIHFIAVPAEEYIEVAYRMHLREKGLITYLGGKPEFVYRGLFDDVDMCIMVHAITQKKKFANESSANGCLVKKIKYLGKAAHAGAAPHDGINALYAANIGLMAINCLRETFRENEYIRVHPIITKGGEVVNVIPAEVTMETFVRGKTMDDILKANKKVDRALAGGALAMGAEVEIENIPGYFPLVYDPGFMSLAKKSMSELAGEDEIIELGHGTGSTDLGDLSAMMPVMQPYIGGIAGTLHGADYKIIDPEICYILGTKLLAGMLIDLLWDRGEAAKNIIKNYHPLFDSKAKYMEFVDRLFGVKVYPEREFFEE